MNTEQIRADFEVFAIPRNYDLDAVMLLSKPPKFSHYVNQATQDAFEAYQAGRAALQSRDREDAERYRWLRDLPEGSPHEEIGNLPGDMWDAAIDHARRAEGGGE